MFYILPILLIAPQSDFSFSKFYWAAERTILDSVSGALYIAHVIHDTYYHV